MAYMSRVLPGRNQSTGPYSLSGISTANQALQRWLGQQQQAQSQFTAAAKPLEQAVGMFQPGGGYGEGQKALLEEQAKQAQAQALANQVASGMSSGSLATGTGLRVQRDLAQSLAGVEDTRTQFLAQALQALSGLRGQQAGTTAAVTDPVTSSFLPYLSNLINTQAGVSQGQARNKLDLELEELKTQQAFANALSSPTIPTGTTTGARGWQ
jgi:hypothetical protein